MAAAAIVDWYIRADGYLDDATMSSLCWDVLVTPLLSGSAAGQSPAIIQSLVHAVVSRRRWDLASDLVTLASTIEMGGAPASKLEFNSARARAFLPAPLAPASALFAALLSHVGPAASAGDRGAQQCLNLAVQLLFDRSVAAASSDREQPAARHAATRSFLPVLLQSCRTLGRSEEPRRLWVALLGMLRSGSLGLISAALGLLVDHLFPLLARHLDQDQSEELFSALRSCLAFKLDQVVYKRALSVLKQLLGPEAASSAPWAPFVSLHGEQQSAELAAVLLRQRLCFLPAPPQ